MHQCYLRGDWDHGLLSLALSDDKQLQELAEQELRGVASADEEVALGDRWWNLAVRGEKGPSEAIKARACYWYKKAHAGLVGFVKDRVQQRLDSLSPKSTVETRTVARSVLLGNWQVMNGSYRGRWTFLPNGVVVASGLSKRKTISGAWKMDSGIVLVRWTPDTWSTLQCPLKLKDTPGDSWQGEKRERLTANKILEVKRGRSPFGIARVCWENEDALTQRSSCSTTSTFCDNRHCVIYDNFACVLWHADSSLRRSTSSSSTGSTAAQFRPARQALPIPWVVFRKARLDRKQST